MDRHEDPNELGAARDGPDLGIAPDRGVGTE